jgi:hypothetical protein
MSDARAFGPWFEGDSWNAWKAVLRAAFALPMSPDELVTFAELAGGRAPPRRRVSELVVIAGRRCGKDSIASMLAANAAVIEENHLGRLRPGEQAFIYLIAADRDQARVVEQYTRSYFREIPDLANMVTRETRHGLELSNGVAISIATNSFRQTRGRTLLLAILDECAFYRDESSASPDIELYRALSPSLSTLPGSMMILISSPYKNSGLLHQKFKASFGKDDDRVLVINASSLQLNPLLDPAEIAAKRELDPEAAKAEWDGLFRDDVSNLLPSELIEASVDVGVTVRPPRPGVQYRSGTDPSGGVRDSFVTAICHDEDGVAVLDCLVEIRAPFNPAEATKHLADVLKSYGLTSTVGDRYAVEWVVSAFAKEGIEYVHADRDRSAIYLGVLPKFTSGQVRLLDDRRLISQFCGLERRTSTGGRDRVDHAEGSFDDCANAAALAMLGGGVDETREFVQAWGNEGMLAEYDREQAEKRRAA